MADRTRTVDTSSTLQYLVLFYSFSLHYVCKQSCNTLSKTQHVICISCQMMVKHQENWLSFVLTSFASGTQPAMNEARHRAKGNPRSLIWGPRCR